MDRRGCRSCRRCLTSLGVLGTHAVLIALFLRAGNQHARTTHPLSEPSTVLLILELPTPQQEPVATKPTAARVQSLRPPRTRPTRTPSDTSISVPTAAPTPRPPIDWHREAELAGSRHALPAPSNLPGGSGHPVSPSVKCKVRPEQHWEPEPKRAGFAGGLPYVRLGRCVVALGFFACALSRSPSNGHVLDDIRDTDYDVLAGADCVP